MIELQTLNMSLVGIHCMEGTVLPFPDHMFFPRQSTFDTGGNTYHRAPGLFKQTDENRHFSTLSEPLQIILLSLA